ncbi:YqcC family protein [Aidingimonas lacisalsi]|uniref:YqcC family protein n=1 Tax=Aidingimonas lacisalsi TaxID=2604086 RepID=UPI0011D23683|nr:YqcC family protein [Aidingimonas lacisalsi]
MNVHQELDESLRRLEATLKAADMWRMPEPPPQAYQSQAPFCLDTMELPQWLRFVFIAKLDTLVEERALLPEKSEVAPAVEHYLKQQQAKASTLLLVVKAIEEVDRVITESD